MNLFGINWDKAISGLGDLAKYGSLGGKEYAMEQEERTKKADQEAYKKMMDEQNRAQTEKITQEGNLQKYYQQLRKEQLDTLKVSKEKLSIAQQLANLISSLRTVDAKESPAESAPTPQKTTPTSTPPQPTPTPWDVSKAMTADEIMSLVEKYFSGETPERKDQLLKTFQRESSGRIGAYHINKPGKPTGLSGDSGYLSGSETPEWWKGQRQAWPSMDVGLTQLSTADAMNNYLADKGYTYWQLLHDPDKNMEVASDLYYGKIPYTAPGLGNWVAASLLGYQ